MQEQHTARLDFNFNGFRFVDVRHGAAEIAIDVVRPESAAMRAGDHAETAVLTRCVVKEDQCSNGSEFVCG